MICININYIVNECSCQINKIIIMFFSCDLFIRIINIGDTLIVLKLWLKTNWFRLNILYLSILFDTIFKIIFEFIAGFHLACN